MKYRVGMMIMLMISAGKFFAQDHRSDSISIAIDFLAHTRTFVASSHTGFAGSKSETYAHYEILKRNANGTQLISFLDHPSQLVRIYSYMALKANKNTIPKAQRDRLLNDKQKILTMSGCIISTSTVADVVGSLEK